MSVIIYIFNIIDSLSNFTTKARTISSQTLGRIRSVHARASTEGLIHEIRPARFLIIVQPHSTVLFHSS
jgi:hypothetical protein